MVLLVGDDCESLGFPRRLRPWRLGGGSLAPWRLYAEFPSLHVGPFSDAERLSALRGEGRIQTWTFSVVSLPVEGDSARMVIVSKVLGQWGFSGLTLLSIRCYNPSVPVGGGVLFLFS